MMISVALVTGCSDSRTWSYVALGDSCGTGVGEKNYVEFFADYLRQDLEVDVEVFNYARPNESTGVLLNRLQTKAELREAVADANVITIWTGWKDLRNPLSEYQNEMCGGADNLDCIRKAVDQINTNIEAILDEILVLNSSEETRVMIADGDIPFVSKWKYHGWFDVLQNEAYESWRDHLVAAAKARDIIVVYTYETLNGPSGDQKLEGIYLEDGYHYNSEGHRLIADLHRDAWE
jgi:lysophospholipase L1-like esterase